MWTEERLQSTLHRPSGTPPDGRIDDLAEISSEFGVLTKLI